MFALLLWCTLISAGYGARILGVFMTPSYSHQVVFQPIWKELSLRGHEVTVLTPNPLNDPTLTNLTEIDLSFSYKTWDNYSIATLGSKEHSTSEELKKLTEAYLAVTEVQLSHPEVQELISNKTSQQFDLILVEFLWPVMYGFKDIFKCPMVGISSLPLTTTANEAIGNPNHPALEPEFTLPYSMNLSFRQRVISTIFKVLFKVSAQISLRPKMERISQKFFGNIRRLEVIAKEVSLVIVNSNLALQNVKPLVPAYVDISGIHIKEKKPLPKDLEKYLDNAKEGVIYFSLGSNVKSELLPKEQMDKIMNTFAKLPYKVLWKFENEHLPNKPKNVEIRKWLPQQDLLRHPNIKLFITQGGLQSLDEAIHSQVPILTIPFFGDQRYNSHHLVENGAGLSIDFHSFTQEEFKEKIVELTNNPKYKEKIIKLSKIASDQPMSALEKAVWWIEYVIRHDGAEHLRYAAIDMPLYQYFLLDVIAFIVAAVALIFYILLRIFKHVVLVYNIFRRLLKSFSTFTPGKSHVE
ncbi:UDP-glucuronosyltransferase 2B20 [Asbolus verrucosus]|uniref:UDP-glucuronosyltransferase n=1 Tax=Asbolus verrucosus TaxID=1661398 RepID=A0A482VKI5_ASBVE|nr:UDP-glucuronosyltransferase 2B20 [Asbolus verrucosus]